MKRTLRSTGCRVCVRRRVKCDEDRPACQRCIKAGLECSGFPPPLQWVDQTKKSQERVEAVRSIASRSLTPKQSAGPTSWQRTPTFSPENNLEYVATLTRELKDSPSSVFSNYLLSDLFTTGRVYDLKGNQPWIATCISKKEQHPTSNLATKALAKAYFGRRKGYQDSIGDASRIYGQALLALCEDLKDPTKSFSFDTLAATVALTLYEELVFTTKQAWVSHSQAVVRLIELSGPERFLKFPDRALFMMNRQILILRALVNRKRTFLEEERWIEVGWIESPERPPIVRLQDIFARLPGMTEDILRMENDPSVDQDFAFAVQTNIDKIVDDLRVLEFDMLVDEMFSSEDKPTSSASTGKPFVTEIKYLSLLAANAWVWLDAVLVLALEWQYKSRHLDWQKGPNHEGCELVPEAQKYSLHICRSVEYLLRPQWMHTGAFYLIFPARVAFMALPVGSPEALWIVGVLERAAIISGFEISRNILTNLQINEKNSRGLPGYKAVPGRALPASPEET